MIVKMKKVTLIVTEKNRDDALYKLRKLGVLHVRSLKNEVTENVNELLTLKSSLEKAETIIDVFSSSKNKKAKDVSLLIEDVLKCSSDLAKAESELTDLQKTVSWFDKFGKISLKSVDLLKENGIYITFYQADKSGLKNIPEDKNIQIAKQDGSVVYCALISEDPGDRLDFKELLMPETEWNKLKDDIKNKQQEIGNLKKKLLSYADYKDSISEFKKELDKKIEFAMVKASMGSEEAFAYIQGFCPDDTVETIKSKADKEGWAYIISDPEDPKEVPTLLRNPKWVNIVKPLFDFMGTLPGYHEIDVSIVFLAFFSIFYAMLIGDAGYGFIFLISTVIFRRKLKDSPAEPFSLMYLLSGATILWGLLSGTWFGCEQIAQLPVLRNFIVPKLDSFSDVSQPFVMQLTFIIGAVHLSVARLMSAFKKINSPTAIAELGWVAILWGIYFVANNLILGTPLNSYVLPLIGAGAFIVALFANFQKNIIKGFLLSLGNLPLDMISSFSDIVSYIRLFAVGFATVIVATSFNDMAAGVGLNSVFSGLIMAVILVFGHGLNIVLGMMAVLVHGVRLNMLEFSGHVGVEWSGKPYMPFKE